MRVWTHWSAAESRGQSSAVAQTPGATTSATQALYDVYVQYDMFPANAVMTDAALMYQERLYYGYHTIDSSPPISKWAVSKYDEAALTVVGKA